MAFFSALKWSLCTLTLCAAMLFASACWKSPIFRDRASFSRAPFSSVFSPSTSMVLLIAARPVCSWYSTSPACSIFIEAELTVACSLLNPSVTTLVFDSDVVFFCSNFTVSPVVEMTPPPFIIPAAVPFWTIPFGGFIIMTEPISPSESG